MPHLATTCFSPAKNGLVPAVIELQAIVGQRVSLEDFPQSSSEFKQGGFAAALLLQELNSDRKVRLVAAVLPGQLVEPPFDGFA